MGQPTVGVARLLEVPEKADGNPPGSFCMRRGLVIFLVLIKDDLFIKRMLPQKASVYPGSILTSEFMRRGRPAAARAEILYRFLFPAGGPVPWGTAPT